MAEGLAIVALILALLCLVMTIALGCFFFKMTLSQEAMKTKLEGHITHLSQSLNNTKERLLTLEEESKNGVETGLYSPIKDQITGKVEYKLVQDFGNLEGLSFDEIMKQAQALADGKAPNGRT